MAATLAANRSFILACPMRRRNVISSSLRIEIFCLNYDRSAAKRNAMAALEFRRRRCEHAEHPLRIKEKGNSHMRSRESLAHEGWAETECSECKFSVPEKLFSASALGRFREAAQFSLPSNGSALIVLPSAQFWQTSKYHP